MSDYSMLTRKSIRGKFVGYYKPDKDVDDRTGGNTWPFLNLPGKGESTWRVNNEQSCLSEQMSKEQSVKSKAAPSYSRQV